MSKKTISSISVSQLKAVLLEVIRKVEKGYIFEVTKDNRKVAVIYPSQENQMPVVGFARGKILEGALKVPDEAWTFDVHNL